MQIFEYTPIAVVGLFALVLIAYKVSQLADKKSKKNKK
jgi:hypothetical protein